MAHRTGADRWFRNQPTTCEFRAPHHERVPTLIDDLIRFAHRTDIDPLAKALLAHAQFETIHPFPDGNGRTGRALIHAMLRRDRLTRNVTVAVSSGLLTEIDRYFDALGAYRNGDPNPIIELGAHASLEAIDNGRQLATEMRDARTVWAERASGVRSDSVAWKVINSLIEHPVVDADSVSSRFNVSAVAARTAINRLAELDILEQASVGLRFRTWIAPDVATALDRFAARSGRRRTGNA